MRKSDIGSYLDDKQLSAHSAKLSLENGSRVAVMGGGPAGSFFSYFLLDQAERVGLELQVDIYEPRDFKSTGPIGCNMCAGIISETLIQALAIDGINLPPGVIQRGMDSYILHNEVGQVRLDTPGSEKRIGTVFRGVGPKGGPGGEQFSFDGFLLAQAVRKGANHIQKRVDGIERAGSLLRIQARGEAPKDYDFLAVAAGINTSALRLFEPLEIEYRPPRTAQTFIREYYLGEEVVQERFGQTIHFFLLDQPGLNFAAIVPKKGYVTICMLGQGLNKEQFDILLNTPQVKSCMPVGWQVCELNCHCSPRINVTGALHPYAERIVFLGDSGVSRLYKDGIGAAYRATKAASTAVIFSGISEADLEQSFGRASRAMERDNVAGKLIFKAVDFLKSRRFFDRALLRVIEEEQKRPTSQRPISGIVWDLFTGSAPYQDVILRLLNPAVWGRSILFFSVALIRRR